VQQPSGAFSMGGNRAGREHRNRALATELAIKL
jgi:hypothetical protein